MKKMAVGRKLFTCLVVISVCPLLYLLLAESGGIYRVNLISDTPKGSPAPQLARPSGDRVNLISDTPKGSPAPQLARPSGDPPVKRVLVVAYGRSGSTFTSSILNEAPGAFLFFEPLRPELTRNTRGEGIIMSYEAIGGTFMKPQELPVSNLTSYERKALKIIEDLFGCDISKYPVTDFHSSHFTRHGDSAKVANCLWNMVSDTYLNLSHYLQCLLHFWHSCRVSPLRIFKVIRLPIRALFSLVRKFPDLRVVYLVRDPRAILMSQRAQFGHAPKAEDFCRMVVDDARHMKLLHETFPGRAVTVRYEDISNDPLEWTRRLYRALQIGMTSKVESGVRRMTSASRKQEGAYSSFRADSKAAASNWRTEVSYDAVRQNDAVCGEACEWLGYKAVPSETVLRNRNVSLTGPSEMLSFL